MTVLTIGEAAMLVLGQTRSLGQARPARFATGHGGGSHVHRGSMEAGTFEDRFFGMPAKGEPDRMLRAARAALDAGRRLKRAARTGQRMLSASERALAGLTAGSLRVFEEICMLARLNAGRVYPSYDWLADATALGRATVARALAALEAAGFLVRQRRFKRIVAEGAGPRYAQTSSVYRPALPARLLPYLPRRFRPAPPPDDVVQRAADREAAIATMEASLSACDLATVRVGGALGKMLARFGAAIDAAASTAERESHAGAGSPPHSYEPTDRRRTAPAGYRRW